MKIVFDPAASDDLDRIFRWISRDNIDAAYNMILRIEARITQLAIPGLAQMGRRGAVEGTRELIEPPYIIVYKVIEDHEEIIVIAIVHGARDR